MNLLSYPALRYCHRTDGGSVTSRFVPDFFDQQRARVARLLALYDGWGMTDARVLGVLGAAYARYLLSGWSARSMRARAWTRRRGGIFCARRCGAIRPAGAAAGRAAGAGGARGVPGAAGRQPGGVLCAGAGGAVCAQAAARAVHAPAAEPLALAKRA